MAVYQLHDLAKISGLTTRTLRNYLNTGVLSGEKIHGAWRFSEADLEHFLSDPSVWQAMSAKRNAVVYDFLSDIYKKENSICMILDFPASLEEAAEISARFIRLVNENEQNIDFRFCNERSLARVILCGPAAQVMDVIGRYYELKA